MPNRIIKESICVSRKINALNPEEEVFFYRLIVNCDDYGCFYGDADVLAGKLFPRRRYPEDKVRKWRDRVCSVGLARTYLHDGEMYIHVLKWEENQQVRSKRRKYPQPGNDDMISDDINGYQMIADAPVIQSNPIQSESESESESICTPRKPTKKTHGEFKNVLLTDDEFSKLGPDAESMIERLSAYKASTGKRYTSDYATILNWQRRDGEQKKAVKGKANFTQREYTPSELDDMYEKVEE